MIDIRPVAADHPDDVGEDAVVPPFLHGLRGGLGEAEIDGAGEKLLGAVDLARRQQFLRADHAQLRALLRADQVLPALAARERKVRRAHVAAAREIGQHARALVVGVRRDHQHRAQFVQLVKRLVYLNGAGKGNALLRMDGRRRQQCQGEGQRFCEHVLRQVQHLLDRAALALDLLLQHHQRVDELLGARRAAGHEHVDRESPGSPEPARSC